MDTEGRELPKHVSFFPARGPIDERRMIEFVAVVSKKRIIVGLDDAGDRKAGSIRVSERPANPKELSIYKLRMNRNHAPPVQFATLAHELGHLFLGHLGPDKALKVPMRSSMEHAQRELEAESVAYLVCARNEVESESKTYVSNFVTEHTNVENLDLYQVMRAAGQVEHLLGLSGHTRFERPNR
jgi:hypothetical protein